MCRWKRNVGCSGSLICPSKLTTGTSASWWGPPAAALPDWQGLGLAMVLIEKLGAAHRALDLRLRTYPAHPALIRSFDKSEHWQLIKKPGTFSTSSTSSTSSTIGELGGRPCAVFEFCGPAMDRRQAERLIAA